ncbi:unnamed protein product [Cylindrotheca closterium]|uniref:Uncharacterized protein n=1 Tax=Cylindrotheca closterium TaxID=2856 RepID=A0AAD2G8P0_9STRA|nr:unnamed protein product [Cylindrotheca closterium]
MDPIRQRRTQLLMIGPSHNPTTESLELVPEAPAASPNCTPTAAPSKKQVLDPPSPKDLAAIRNNQTIPGDNTLSKGNWNANILINVKGDSGLTPLLDSIQELLLPALAGCTNGDQRKLIVLAQPEPRKK